MSGIQTFQLICRQHNLVCDDVLFDYILKILRKAYCKKCYSWIGEKKIKACFFETSALCFYCYHKSKYPKF